MRFYSVFIIAAFALILWGCSSSTEPEDAKVEIVNVQAVSTKKFGKQLRGFSGTVKNTGNVTVKNCRIEFFVYKTAQKEEYRADFDSFTIKIGKLSPNGTYDFNKLKDSFNSDIEHFDYEINYGQ